MRRDASSRIDDALSAPLEQSSVVSVSARRPLSPAQLIALSFLLVIALGTLLLWLPVAHAPEQRVTFLDALFTATSAVCVTGLVVVDTGSAYSVFGRVVIMLLIQAGGLGIITMGTLFALAVGRRVGFSTRLRLATQLNTLGVGGMVRLIRNIALLTFVAQGVGAALLYARFYVLEGPSQGAFFALFHSISAFNNAGFAFYSDSLVRFATDPFVNLVMIALIVLGGLGYLVQFNLIANRVDPRRFALSLHSKLVLTITAVLVVLGTLLVLVFEWHNPFTLGPLPWPNKLLAALFQSVTPRTAGFNTLDYANMQEATLLFTMLLMFIGGSPGSSAGGIKTVTFFVLIGSAWSISRGRGELTLFGRRITTTTALKASMVALFGMMLIGAALTALTLTEAGQDTLDLAFEVVSAFATVGLSTGVTSELSLSGRLIIIALMYIGRIGPLTFAVALIAQRQQAGVRYPEEGVLIG